MKLSKLNQKGFSLVELMVVVAIIGILATIGIPQYQKFMAKARQSEAKTHLNAIFQGEASFFTEYNMYTPNLRAIGAAAVGQSLRYNAGFDIITCTNYFTTAGAPPLPAAGDNDLRSVSGAAAGWYHTTQTDPAISACTTTGYTAGAWGNPNNNGTAANNEDQFSINEARMLRQVQIGI